MKCLSSSACVGIEGEEGEDGWWDDPLPQIPEFAWQYSTEVNRNWPHEEPNGRMANLQCNLLHIGPRERQPRGWNPPRVFPHGSQQEGYRTEIPSFASHFQPRRRHHYLRGRFTGGNLGPRAPSPGKRSGNVTTGTTLDALPFGFTLPLVFATISTTLFAGSALLNL